MENSTSPGHAASKYAIAREKLGRLRLPDLILLAFAKHPADVPRPVGGQDSASKWTIQDALRTLKEAFPDFMDRIKGKRVLDYGCGDGFQTVAMASSGADFVLGVDIDQNRLRYGRKLAAAEQRGNVDFQSQIAGQWDIVITLDAMEHFPDPAASLREMRDALMGGGAVLMSFGPLWLAPYGSHMHFWCWLPWVNILFSERSVYRIRSLYRDDDATSYEPGVNKMTLARFERLILDMDMEIVDKHYTTVKRIPLVEHIPLLRELFVNQVAVVLQRSR